MVPIIFILSFLMLAAFLLLGFITNWLTRRYWLNAAWVFFWLLLAFAVGVTVFTLMDDSITLQGHRIIGQATAALIPSLLLSFFLGKRFQRKARAFRAQAMHQS